MKAVAATEEYFDEVVERFFIGCESSDVPCKLNNEKHVKHLGQFD